MWSLGCILAEMITGMIAVVGNCCDDNISNFFGYKYESKPTFVSLPNLLMHF